MSRALRAGVAAVGLLAGLLVATGTDGLRQRRQQALVHAAAKGQVPIIRALLAVGADPASNATGAYPLYAAAWNGRTAAIELLLDRGAAIDAAGPSGATALMAAAAQGHDDAARVLLARGASVGASCASGNALDLALANGHPSTAAILRGAGAAPQRSGPE